MRLQIGLFGRTNVGKSSFLNRIAAQDVSITSSVPGTTTDVVEKAMELLPVGPVLFLDTAGLDDDSELSAARLGRTRKVLERADIFVLISEAGEWHEVESGIVAEAKKRKVPLILVVNKVDLRPLDEKALGELGSRASFVMTCSCKNPDPLLVYDFKRLLIRALPEDALRTPPLVGDLLPPGGTVVLIVPIDKEAPKGRLILPQVQTIRDALDHGAGTVVVREHEYGHTLSKLKDPPHLVVCDSQVVHKMVAETPAGVPCTTFSILFARLKANLEDLAEGAAAIHHLKSGDRILISESCTHHPIEGDIGRVKIPNWLREKMGLDLRIEVVSGRDFPSDLSSFRLIMHCGSCMLTRREMLVRLQRAKETGVAITNYGVAISVLQGVAERVLSPFPAALDAYRAARQR